MPTVIAADDSSMIRIMLKKFLRDSEFEIVGLAKDGDEAVAMYKEYRPDIVTLDITMPGLNGLGALMEITEFDPEAKCIMLTTLDQDEMIDEAMQHGARGYIIKPFEGLQLIEKMREVVGQ
ncbi:MAG: response regulator [Planctomycetes bacterium]|nr:response regulator [Planctomycetota bacterium]